MTGIEVSIGGRGVFVGKVGVCPRYPDEPRLEGHSIFYREAPLADAFLKKEQALSVDYRALQKAKELGAVAFANYCPRTGCLMIASLRHMMQWPVTSEGAGSQCRIPASDITTMREVEPIPMGWTANVETVGQPLPAPNQMNLFE